MSRQECVICSHLGPASMTMLGFSYDSYSQTGPDGIAEFYMNPYSDLKNGGLQRFAG